MHPYDPAKLLQGPLEGQLTVVAGLHGSGKTALLAGLAAWLQAQKVNAVVIDEPDLGRTVDELEDELIFQKQKTRELRVHVLRAYTPRMAATSPATGEVLWNELPGPLRQLPTNVIGVHRDHAPLESVTFVATLLKASLGDWGAVMEFNPAELLSLAPKG